jgi:predicted DNA-binding transcriptional regulator AlpA
MENVGPPPPVHLMSKSEVLAVAGVTYPTIWKWMREQRFPRSRVVGGLVKWRSDEIEKWLAELPMRALKGDQPSREIAAPISPTTASVALTICAQKAAQPRRRARPRKASASGVQP